MQIVVRIGLFLAAAALAGVAASGCAVNDAGLGGGTGHGGVTGGPAGSGGTAGTTSRGGTTGSAGTGGLSPVGQAGTSGSAGTTGDAGTTGQAGTGSAGDTGTGDAGTTGAAGTTDSGTAGAAGTGSAGTTGNAGTGGAAGTGPAGTTGSAGTAGTGGVSGTSGRGGTGGRGGTTGCSASTCPNGCCQAGQCVTSPNNQACGNGGGQCRACASCFQCGSGHTCEPDPSASWTVTCDSAVVKSTKPNGMSWDTGIGGTGNPDPYCRLSTNDGRSRSTNAITDDLTPMWNASVTPTSGGGLTAQLILGSGWTITVLDQDTNGPSGGSSEVICQTTPSVTATVLESGTLTISSVDSCTSLVLGFTCAQ